MTADFHDHSGDSKTSRMQVVDCVLLVAGSLAIVVLPPAAGLACP